MPPRFVRPSGALAALSGPPAGVFSRWVGSVSGESAAIAAPGQFALVGVEWSGPANARIELRTRRSGAEAWSAWAVASVLGHGPDRTHESGGADERAGLFGEPIWSGPADYVQLRSSHAVTGLRLHFVAARAGTAAGARRPGDGAGPADPRRRPRPAADHRALGLGPGARPAEPRPGVRHGQARVRPPQRGANGYSAGEVPSILQSIFDYHVYVRGFWDIAYNFAVDAFGRIWEARAGGVDLPVVGAHAGGYNQESTGMVVLGTFTDVVPSPAAIGALEHLLAWKLSLHGVPALGRVTVEVAPYDAFYTPFAPGAHVSLPRIAGHRDGDTTDCPGNAFYARLPSIRPPVAGLAGKPARATIVGTVDAGQRRRHHSRVRAADGPLERRAARRCPDRTAADRSRV